MPQNATKYGINVSKNCSKLKTNDNEISVFFTEYENCDKNSFYAFYEMASESSKKGEKVRTFEMRHFWCFLTTVVCGCSTILHWPSPLATMRFWLTLLLWTTIRAKRRGSFWARLLLTHSPRARLSSLLLRIDRADKALAQCISVLNKTFLPCHIDY